MQWDDLISITVPQRLDEKLIKDKLVTGYLIHNHELNQRWIEEEIKFS